MAEQRGQHYYNSPYKFNGKELDEETGLYYYGARYYDPRVSIWLSVDPLAERHPEISPFVYCANNPILYIDPDGRDWFVNNQTGQVVYIKGESKVSQELFDKMKYGGNPESFERLGADNMFGDKVKYGRSENILERDVVFIENSEKFMNSKGYKKAEKVTIKESEFTSGGAMGSEERITQVYPELKQIGDSKITYTKPENLNKTVTRKETSGSSSYSSSRTITYDLTKPYGQDNHVTAKYYSNRSTNYSMGITISDKLIQILKAVFQTLK